MENAEIVKINDGEGSKKQQIEGKTVVIIIIIAIIGFFFLAKYFSGGAG